MVYVPYNDVGKYKGRSMDKFTIEFYENTTRVLYFFYYDGKIILTNEFVKKTQKPSKLEIECAKIY